tara:strand:+ start:479 stop:1867 length:1389 start_codon:yes stop_codon:yes gene_type:complete
MDAKDRFHLTRFSYHNHLTAVVLDRETELPALLPLIYLQSWGLSRAINTVQQHMVSICQWYNYWQTKHNRSFDEMVFERDTYGASLLAPLNALDAALSDYAGFTGYINGGQRHADIGAETGLQFVISSATLDVRLGSLTQFFLFLVKRYVSSRYTGLNSREQKSLFDSYRFRFQSARRDACGRLSVRSRQSFKNTSGSEVIVRERSLTKQEMDAIVLCARPSTSRLANTLNPWQKHPDSSQIAKVQIRNYLVIRLLSNYGLRLGELLLLRTRSLIPYESGTGHALAVTTYEGNGDPRKVPPRLKNSWSERLVELAPEDVTLWEMYVEHLRGKPSHPFLLVNSRKNQAPLSIRAAQEIFDRLYEALDRHFPSLCRPEIGGTLITLNPHMFRFTWATETFQALVEKDSCDFEAAKDRLRQLGGWSDTSPMPQKYAARYIAKSANDANVRRVNGLRQQHRLSDSK